MGEIEISSRFNSFKRFAVFLAGNNEELTNEYVKLTQELSPEFLSGFESKAELIKDLEFKLHSFFKRVVENSNEYNKDLIANWFREWLVQLPVEQYSNREIRDFFTLIKLAGFSLVERFSSDLNLIKELYKECELFYKHIIDAAISLKTSSHNKELEQIKEIDEGEINFKKIAENLKEAQAISQVGNWEYDLVTQRIFWSDELFRIFGYEPNEVEMNFQSYISHVHSNHINNMVTTVEETIKTKKPYTIEHKIVTKNGEEKWILGKGEAECSSNGEIIKLKGIASDITQRKLSELEVWKKNQELSLLLEKLKSAEDRLIKANSHLEKRVKERTEELATVNNTGKIISSELDLNKLVQKVTDITTKITGAEFGAFFYNINNEKGESYTLYTISGVPKEKFSSFPLPRNTKVFGPTFRGEGTVRIDDVTKDPRYGHNAPYHGMPKGHLPVKSYLAVPVISRSGQVLGGLFYGHSKPGIFKEKAEAIVEGIASQAAIAIDNARLYEISQQNEKRLKSVLESMPTMAWTANAAGEMEYFNQRFYTFTGKTFENAQGWNWIEVIHPDDKDGFIESWQNRLKDHQPFQIEFRIKNHDGGYKWQLCRALPLFEEDKDWVKWFGTCTNIHEQKETAEKMLATNEELIKINEFLDTFVYIAAHDLRSPLSNLRMILDLFQKTNEPAKKQELLSALKTSVNKLDQTVNGLVKIIEIQSTDTSMVKPLAFHDVLNNVKEDYTRELKEKKIEVLENFASCSHIKYIEAYLISIVKNLIGNAIKYHSPERKPKIRITTKKVDGSILLIIADNGVGIDLSKYGKNLFKPFTRFSKIAEGKGLGLYLVKNMVEKNGGKIVLESTPDEGTTFNVYLKEYN